MIISSIVVLAGGLGTRSQNPSVPKILQLLDRDTSLLDVFERQLSQLPGAKIFWLLAHNSERIESEIIKRGLGEIVKDPGDGTSSAMFQISDSLPSGKCLILLGDTALGLPLAAICEELPEDAGLVFFGRQSDHVGDSDAVAVNALREVSGFFPKGSPLNDLQKDGVTFSLSGITIVDNRVLSHLSREGDLQQNLYLATVANGGAVRFLANSWFARDTGTASRLRQARLSLLTGVYSRRSADLRRAIFIDRDGTIIPDAGEGRVSLDRHEIAKSVGPLIALANQAGIPVFLVTNQPGIAKGFITEADLYSVTNSLFSCLADAGAFFDDYEFCPHHPEAGWAGEVVALKVDCSCRKPETGMILKLAGRHRLNLEGSFMIGDSGADQEAADKAGMTFLEAKWDEQGSEFEKAMLFAIGKLLR